ncbi:MAG: alanyl-tRNA synthetase [Bacteroidetes bacterium]|nr:alanyl-tRNA synthetase [Bacteroidota bacterium]MBS1740751.1 alanyl-tRNA synthetase [Bacteroidota bacterium]MBS1776439.1 alanyl-tRNA synthetase [Bacteroidota bacterium]
METMPTPTRGIKFTKWLKKLGFWGFVFFLTKGLAWIALGYFAVK